MEAAISESFQSNSSEGQGRGNRLPLALIVDVWSAYQTASGVTSAIGGVDKLLGVCSRHCLYLVSLLGTQ